MLFDPLAHEWLTEDTWEPDAVRAAIREISEDAEGSFDDGWPTHPQDSESLEDEERRFHTVYLGGSGVVQALDSLQRRGLRVGGTVHRSCARVRGLRARLVSGR